MNKREATFIHLYPLAQDTSKHGKSNEIQNISLDPCAFLHR